MKAGLRVKLDDSDNSMGWKCAQYEMKGVPVRVEIGPRDIEAGQCVLVRRNDGEKTVVALENLEAAVAEQLELVQKGMFEKAKQNLDNHISTKPIRSKRPSSCRPSTAASSRRCGAASWSAS